MILDAKLSRLFVALMLFLVSTTVSVLVRAEDDVLTVHVEETDKSKNAAEAAREAQRKAMADTARDQVIDLIGDKKFAANRKMIDTKIIREANRFIPFVKKSDPVKLPDGSWKIKMELRVSLTSLRRMIFEAGLLSEGEAQVSVLPTFSIVDRSSGKGYQWWAQASSTASNSLRGIQNELHKVLSAELGRSGFYLITPPESGFLVPPFVSGLDPQAPQDMRILSKLYRVPLILVGDLKMRNSPTVPGVTQVLLKMSVQNVSLGRVAAEVSRSLETEAGLSESMVLTKLRSEFPEIARDLSLQLFESWKRGSLGANSLSLVVRPIPSPQKIAEFRQQMLRSIRAIKAVRERLFDQGSVTFEIDFVGGQGQQLAEKIRATTLTGFEAKVVSSSNEQVALDLKSL